MKRTVMSALCLRTSSLLLIGFLITACGPPNPGAVPAPLAGASDRVATDLAQVLPGEGDLSGWTPAGEAALYDEETLFELVNGQADAFFAYNFRQVAVRSYEGDEGNVLRVEVWELATDADAYGLFTRNAAGTPSTGGIGNDADGDLGRRLAFWQDRYFVQIRARQPVTGEAIETAGMAVAAALPEGGARPSLIDAAPLEGRTDEPVIFFRQEISIQDEIWLGGENVLGLGPNSEGVLARYEIAGTPALLLLTRYETVEEAEAARARLVGSTATELSAVEAQGATLAALFGALEPDAAQAWLAAHLHLEP